MRISTRPADDSHLSTVAYATEHGEGTVTFRDGMPWELTLPGSPAERAVTAPSQEAGGLWVSLLERYFRGERVDFPLDVESFAAARGCTRFEAAVLRVLASVPYGATVSYGELAARAGSPRAARAAGSVMARNPLPVVLPCHRVVHADGSLGRYGDDPRWKARLLRLEGALPSSGEEPRE